MNLFNCLLNQIEFKYVEAFSFKIHLHSLLPGPEGLRSLGALRKRLNFQKNKIAKHMNNNLFVNSVYANEVCSLLTDNRSVDFGEPLLKHFMFC